MGTASSKTTTFTSGDLENAQSASTEKPTEDQDYLAVAIPRINITEQNTTWNLGDNTLSDCDVRTNFISRRKRRNTKQIYEAKNWPLHTGVTYSFYVVTATPVENGILFKRSETTRLETFSPRTDSQLTWIVGLIVALLVIVGVLILSRHLYKKKNIGVGRGEGRQRSGKDQGVVVYANLETKSNRPRSETDILLQRLQSVYENFIAEGNLKFREQFQKLKLQTNANENPTKIASRPSLKNKNRYKNILPYDSSRVVLQGEADDNYINACFVHGYNQQRKFIASQGPLPNTVDDFWRMVVEQKSKVIVMLTRCNEKGKVKCEKYWPDLGEKQTHGEYTITNSNEENFGSFVKRTLTISAKNEEAEALYSNIQPQSASTINQFHFMTWPDHGVPATTSAFFRFYKATMSSQGVDTSGPPIIVHCSAGAGRTGTFIGYDNLLEESRSKNRVDIYNCVVTMRNQRVDMVQTLDQYVFLHQLLLENYLYGDTEIESSNISKILAEKLNGPENGCRIDEEYRKLSLIDAHVKGSKEENDNQEAVAVRRWKVVIVRQPGETGDLSINASYVEAFSDSIRLIAAQTPGPGKKIEFFWRAVFDNDVSTIVMLNKTRGQKIYWPSTTSQGLDFGNITVELVNEHEEHSIVERKFALLREKGEKNVVQYQYTGWEASCPEEPAALLDLISKLKSNGMAAENAVALVHCSDGVGRTGVLCVIMNLVDRLKIEERVDVFRAVKDLRDIRLGMVQNLEEYHFCYKVVQAYLDSVNLYSNVAESSDPDAIYQNVQSFRTP